MSIEEKVVIITGASSGIGEATARELGSKGAKVVLAARREDRLKLLQDSLKKDKIESSYKVVDVTSNEEMEQLAQFTLDQYGQIDAIVNNAGLMPLANLSKKKIDEWNTMIDVNIKGLLYGIGAVLPHMRERKSGHIINISSVAGHEVMPGGTVYCGTKFAVRAITEGLRKEEAAEGNNIRTTIISPGAVATELVEHITDLDAKQGADALYDIAIPPESIARAIAHAIGEPNDVATNEIIIRPTAQEL
ncbi:SDR family oxidoreductase [Alkalicoccobacillus porphyridii]|uniref:SDR family oxidoreductase n=1 Tax=Alkalicoccobacillus porphyridii TaxID=2597270 RepID=A0A553ZVG6_9BACI|nr:SDR family oxidoreductase [Alkalicoccobacillus porphyridii]TSB45422.1 SDR family oxidoreductase [Alkalicoccobacillus porphyridii]